METKKIEFRIALGLEGMRLDKALATQSDIQTRSRAAKLIQEGWVTLQGNKVKASQQTVNGQVFEILIPVEQPLELEPYDFPLDVYHEDEDLIVVNKPAGLVVHPAAGHSQDTLVNALVHRGQELSMGFGEKRPGIVHRLDKDTSGLLVVAKNDHSHSNLCQQFREKTVHRIYQAMVFGEMREPKGTINSYLARHPTDRKKYASIKTGNKDLGKIAITHYRQIHTHPSKITVLECQLETGRTHQIRVHLSEAGCPIIGDDVYGSSGRSKNLKSVQLRTKIEKLPRIALHARELGFIHPKTGDKLLFTSNWPEDLSFLSEHVGL